MELNINLNASVLEKDFWPPPLLENWTWHIWYSFRVTSGWEHFWAKRCDYDRLGAERRRCQKSYFAHVYFYMKGVQKSFSLKLSFWILWKSSWNYSGPGKGFRNWIELIKSINVLKLTNKNKNNCCKKGKSQNLTCSPSK